MASDNPVIVIYPGQVAGPSGHAGGGQARGENPVPTGAVDPHKTHKDFPALWSAFVRGNFRDLRQVSMTFGVSERTARAWWNGETGVNGAHIATAFRVLPAETLKLLSAA